MIWNLLDHKQEDFLWQKIAETGEGSELKEFIEILSYLLRAQELEYDIFSQAYIIISMALEFIKKRNGLMNTNPKAENAQEAYQLLDWIKKIKINDRSLDEEIEIINKQLVAIAYKNRFPIPDPMLSHKVFRFNQDPLIRKINPSDIKKIEPPIYSRRTWQFQVCIYKATYKDLVVAVKMYQPLIETTDNSSIYNEINIYETLSKFAKENNCFLKYYRKYIEENKINIIMEYIEDNLMKYLTKSEENQSQFTEELIISIFNKLLTSFAEMENLGIYHMDIKPKNLLVNQYLNIKIIDFSISLKKNEELTQTATGMNPIQGTECYSAPELEDFHDSKQVEGKYRIGKSDVFSLGIVFLQMLLMIPLKNYNTRDKNQELMDLINNTVEFPWAKKLCRNMLSLNPKKRHRFSNLLKYLPSTAPTAIFNKWIWKNKIV